MSDMKNLKVVATKTADLKWEPQLVVVSPFKALPEESWQSCLDLIDEKDIRLLEELDSVIETAKDDHVLYIVLAYSEDEIVGFALLNAWSGQTKSKAILLSYVAGLDDYDKANGMSRLTGQLLVERTMQEALNLKNHDTIKDLTEVYCIAKDTWAHDIIRRFQFVPVPAY